MHLRVNGIPGPQGSKRHVGGGVMIESSKAVGPWREAIRAECQRMTGGRVAFPRPCAVIVNITFWLPRPIGHWSTGANAGNVKPGSPAHPAVKPDRDKLERAVMDGLTSGGAWDDDAQVVSGITTKAYADAGQATGCDVWIRPASQQKYSDYRE